MRIAIDNLDGLGAVDYTASVCPEGRVRIERKLNVPSRCAAVILAGLDGLTLPVRRARVVVSSDGGNVLFTGYVVTEPVRVLAGTGLAGSLYRARVTAISDEWLLDKQGSGAASSGDATLALDSLTLLQRLATRAQGTGGSVTVATGGPAGRAVGAFSAGANVPWSVNAGSASAAGYAAYRAIAGEVLLQPAGSVTHALSDADGTLDVREFQIGERRELANDVTLTGEEEPTAYVCESFAGDGTTALFTLSETAFESQHKTLIDDAFAAPTIDASVWSAGDPGSHFSITSAGLSVSGGTGFDGQTRLTALDALEMGGSIVIELGSVMLGAASDGMLGGVYAGTPVLANCVAGFRVRQSASGTGSATLLAPVVNGTEVGVTFAPDAAHKYTLRLRIHCVEIQRVGQRYYSLVDGVVEGFGSASGVDAPLDVVFELVDQGAASNTPATVLYDSANVGAVLGTAPTCVFVAVNATQIYGSIGSVRLTRPGSIWVTSTLPSGMRQTRLMGLAGEGVDCVVEYGSLDRVTFLAGRVPVAGERLTVQYRGRGRSVARLQDAASVAAEAVGGGPRTSRWLGKVLAPIARNSADCESAAQAVLAFATSRTAAVGGTYALLDPANDVWPGDILSVTSDGVVSAFLVRSVTVEDGGAAPELVRYSVDFANDWAAELADGLGLRLSEAIAADASLPASALSAPEAVLANLQQLTVTSVTTTTLAIDAGLSPPSGGGFEVRRRGWDFGPGNDVDLVLRSPVRSFSIPRAAQVERYFVRMYDGSATPVYSRFSSAVFMNAPVS